MNKTNKILLILLAVQIGLTALTWAPGTTTEGPSGRKLLDVAKAEIKSIEVIGRPIGKDLKPETVKLVKQGDDWILDGTEGYAAKKEKVDEMLDKLVDVTIGEPIATNKANHNKLRVGVDSYGKKLNITVGSETKHLVVGSGGANKIHVRFKDEDQVYEGRGVAEWALHNSMRNYIDTEYVKIESDNITRVSVVGPGRQLSLAKNGGAWTLAELPAGKQLDETKVKSFVSALARVTLMRPVTKEATAEHGLDNGITVTIQATDSGEEKTVEYTIGGKAKENEYYVKAKDKEFIVTVSEWATKQARTKKIDELVKEDKGDSKD